jgi:outer membrane protein TolC
VQVVTGLYLQSLAGQARVDSAQAEFSTAKAIYDQTLHQKEAGMAAGIDVLRSQVEMQALEQRVLASQNDLEKQKLTLARAIGLPDGQQFTIADDAPYVATPVPTFEEARQIALQKRADYQQAISLVRANELARKAASAEHLPSLQFDGDYGTQGRAPGNSHGTFTAAATLAIPIFQGGRVKADVLRADAQLGQTQAQADDLRGRISQELRNALMDLNTSSRQVAVARSSVELATRQLVQSRDRFRSGVANTIEVVQAQESVANASESFIASVHAYNLAKASLARAMGVAETNIINWFKVGQ